MPKLFTPDHPRFEMPELKEVVENPGYDIEASTLGELLDKFHLLSGSKLVPHDPPKYFRYFKRASSDDYVLVDVHVTRMAAEICPKQDLHFHLKPDDVVEAGVLIC